MSIKSTFLAATKAVIGPLVPQKKAAPDVAPPAVKKPGPDPQPPTVLLAWRSPAGNPTLLVAYKPDTDPNNPNNLVSVIVRSNHNFLPHMKLRVQHVGGTIYSLVGPLPRYRGRY